MTKELLQSRLQQLEAQKEQLVANANALNGAIQECQFWMAALDKITAVDPAEEIHSDAS